MSEKHPSDFTKPQQTNNLDNSRIVDQYGNTVHIPQPESRDQYGNAIPIAQPIPGTQTGMNNQYAHAQPVSNQYVQPRMVVVESTSNIARDAHGNALCRKCHSPYPLPQGCTSWRCRNCNELNNTSIYGDECCNIL